MKMSGFPATLVILSALLFSVVAYRNDLSSTRHGCVWSTIENPPVITTTTPSQGGLLIPSSNLAGGVSLNCNLRTLSKDFWNYTFNREQIERTRLVRIKCSDKLFFESMLSPDQTLFHLSNLVEVQIESCKIRKLPGRLWSSLTKMKSLVIQTQAGGEWKSSSGLEIENGAFEGLDSLVSLDLSQNNLYTIPKDSLCPLSISLVSLNLSNNALSDISELITTNSCELRLKSLDLSQNALRRVGRQDFSRMKKLTHLKMQNNLIAELEDYAFSSLTDLLLLNLSSNRLVALPDSIFKMNLNLRELYLQNNSISAISSQVFANLEHLALLDLSMNSLSSQILKGGMFSRLRRIVVLHLNQNQLSFIDDAIFKDLNSLQHLDLSNNRIETIAETAFQSLTNLHILNLSNNKLSYVDGRLFSNLFVLSKLYMDFNKIRKVHEDSMKNCTSLSDLGLSGNVLQEVPVALRGLSMLSMLDIGDNKIVSVNPDSFQGMNSLYGLRLAENNIGELNSGFCSNLKKLRVLNVASNKIVKISPTAFTNCEQLRVLRLDSNGKGLTELPDLTQLSSLLWLNVSVNGLTSYPKSLPLSLEWLDLSWNSISLNSSKTIPSLNQMSLNNLRVLDMSYNKIQHIDQGAIPSSLETLRINHNKLETVAPDTFLLSKRLRRVELIGNQIENLPLTSIRLPPIPSGRNLPEFFLGGNPFLCDCSMEWLTRVNQLAILRQHPRIVDLDAIVCRTTFSRSLTGMLQTTSNDTLNESRGGLIPLVEARPRDFLCPYKSHCFALCHCCEFDACDCEMTCPGNCSCWHDTAWSSNIVECSNLHYEDIPKRLPMDSTEIYLDGNRIYSLGSHIFIGKKNLRILFLNDSHVEVIKNKTFNGLKSLEVLRLEENLLTELHGYEFEPLESLRELYLHNNLIKFIAPETFVNLKFLQILRIDGNSLIDFNVWELSRNGYLNSIMLAGNPWSCDCEFLNPFRSWVASKTAIVADFTLAKCQMLSESSSWSSEITLESRQLRKVQPTISSMCNEVSDITFNYEQNGHINEIEINNHISPMGGAEKVTVPQNQPPSENHLNFSRLETSSDGTIWTLILCLTAFAIVIVVILAIFRKEIYYWCRNTLPESCCCCPTKGSHHPGKISCPSKNEDEKLFDAYFLYGRQDEDMLLQKIAPELELGNGGGHKLRLCLHYRDLCLSPESMWNRELILSACDASKRVVILLSRTFLQSEWSYSGHFRQAIQSAIALHQKKIIFITLPDFDQGISTISSELSSSTIKNSTLQWTDKNFWSKFRKLLPSPSSISSHGESGNNYQQQCDPHTLPYNLVMNPNLQNLHHQLQSQTLRSNPSQHYHQNILPYQIPIQMTRNDSLPPVPKHQIVLPALPTWEVQQNTLNINPAVHHHNNIIAQNHSVIHPIPSQLTPQQFGYSNETFHLHSNHHQNLQNHQNHHLLHPGHNNHQPIHFSSQQPPQVIPPHSHTSSQISNTFSSSVCCPHKHNHNHHGENYSSSAVSSLANDEFDHVYSTLDSPLHSPKGGNSTRGNCDGESKGPRMINSKHKTQHSASSGVSSGGSDINSGSGDSSAVSPSSPIKNGILNKLNSSGSNNGKMYFV